MDCRNSMNKKDIVEVRIVTGGVNGDSRMEAIIARLDAIGNTLTEMQ